MLWWVVGGAIQPWVNGLRFAVGSTFKLVVLRGVRKFAVGQVVFGVGWRSKGIESCSSWCFANVSVLRWIVLVVGGASQRVLRCERYGLPTYSMHVKFRITGKKLADLVARLALPSRCQHSTTQKGVSG